MQEYLDELPDKTVQKVAWVLRVIRDRQFDGDATAIAKRLGFDRVLVWKWIEGIVRPSTPEALLTLRGLGVRIEAWTEPPHPDGSGCEKCNDATTDSASFESSAANDAA